MNILIYIAAYGIGIAFSTVILATSLFLVENNRSDDSSFRIFGVFGTFARCAGLVIISTLVASLIPFGLLLALIIWFLGILFLFKKSFPQTLLIFVVNAVASVVVARAIVYVLAKWLSTS